MWTWRGRMNTSCLDSACMIWSVGPTCTDPGLFNKIRNWLLMVCRPLCPWDEVWWLEFKNQLKPVFSKHMSQVLEFHSGFKYCSIFPYLSEISLSSSISLPMPQSTTPSPWRDVTEFFAQTTCSHLRFGSTLWALWHHSTSGKDSMLIVYLIQGLVFLCKIKLLQQKHKWGLGR